MTRKYRKRRRAEQEEETRRRITEALVDLHGSVGPAGTTIREIAERAGVQRATVYRHFPDEASMLAACSAHWAEQNPFPDPGAWAAIDDPDRRLRAGLSEIYAFYSRNEKMLDNTIGHALSFTTWRSLVREQGLEPENAVSLMAGMIDALGRRESPSPQRR